MLCSLNLQVLQQVVRVICSYSLSGGGTSRWTWVLYHINIVNMDETTLLYRNITNYIIYRFVYRNGTLPRYIEEGFYCKSILIEHDQVIVLRRRRRPEFITNNPYTAHLPIIIFLYIHYMNYIIKNTKHTDKNIKWTNTLDWYSQTNYEQFIYNHYIIYFQNYYGILKYIIPIKYII